MLGRPSGQHFAYIDGKNGEERTVVRDEVRILYDGLCVLGLKVRRHLTKEGWLSGEHECEGMGNVLCLYLVLEEGIESGEYDHELERIWNSYTADRDATKYDR